MPASKNRDGTATIRLEGRAYCFLLPDLTPDQAIGEILPGHQHGAYALLDVRDGTFGELKWVMPPPAVRSVLPPSTSTVLTTRWGDPRHNDVLWLCAGSGSDLTCITYEH